MNRTPTTLDILKRSDLSIRTALASFIKQDAAYKNQYLQSAYQVGFDGYSYIGQKDSLNQYPTDLLHSFVLSDLQDSECFPKEFHAFFREEWQEIITAVKAMELSIVEQLDIPDLTNLYAQDSIGYMMSCNYYPNPSLYDFTAANNTRLSVHKDVSLFTSFPFGLDEGLSYFDNNVPVAFPAQDNMCWFAGYFLEFVSQRKFTALDHQVNLPPNMNADRFSFAVFSIPKPLASFTVGDRQISSEEYYQAYLSLF